MASTAAKRLVVTGLVLALGCGASDTGPSISDVTPAQAAPGAAVVITGARFCGDAANRAQPDGRCVTPVAGYVNFGLEDPVLRASVTAWTDTQIDVTVPQVATAGATDLVVTVNGVASNSVGFEVQ
jgi:uncharacterized protein (TIGR03437 family)